MKTRFLTLLILASITSLPLLGQDTETPIEEVTIDTLEVEERVSIIDRLCSTEGSQGSIEINEVADAKVIMDSIKMSQRSDFVRGYRVGIFFDNGQSARNGAITVRNRFVELHPDIKVYVTYENPYFKVAAGDCIEQEEAVILLEKIRHNFPKAFIQRDNIAIEAL
ncbi:MAG: hypothetical protein SNJ33_04180 [Rikenellaceae bacterium]